MIYLTRRIDFAAMHVYHVPTWSSEENRQAFGRCNNPNGHGHNYRLEVTVKGELNPASGIVVNTADIKSLVQSFVNRELDGKFLNREHPYFERHMPTTENLAVYIWDALYGRFEGCTLHQVRLHENHYLLAAKEAGNMVSFTRKYHFCAAHRLHSDQLSPEENLRLFGKCNNPHGHGHNYYLEVTVRGVPDPVTGMVIDLAALDEIVERHVLDKVDHKHLNLDTPEFSGLNPTSEVVTKVFYDMLKPHLPQLNKIGLWETENNYFEYNGAEDSHECE